MNTSINKNTRLRKRTTETVSLLTIILKSISSAWRVIFSEAGWGKKRKKFMLHLDINLKKNGNIEIILTQFCLPTVQATSNGF